jgi:DNA adenine methylase
MDDQTARGVVKPTQPLFRWAGSKRQILPELASYWSEKYTRYVEPFAGSAALFFKLQPARAVLGDINAGLIEAYEVIRDRPDDVHAAAVRIPQSESQYYKVRAQNPRKMKAFGRAVRFVYLNRFCFNGIFRTNALGTFNVPFGHSRTGAMPPIEEFRRCAILLQTASLKCGDFGAVLSAVKPGDFVYMDPPYAVEARRVFRQYDKREFRLRDVERLTEHLISIDKKGASFVVSYADCSEARRLLGQWDMRRIKVRRHVSGFTHGRRAAYELLVSNAAP